MHPRRAESGSERRQHVSSEDRPSSRARSAFPRPRTTGRGRPGSQPSRDKPCGSCRSTCCLRRVRAARGVCGGARWSSGGRETRVLPPGWLELSASVPVTRNRELVGTPKLKAPKIYLSQNWHPLVPLPFPGHNAERAMAARCMKIRIADGLPVEETAVVRKEDREKADALIKKLQDELIGNALRAMQKHPGRWDEVEGVRELLGPRLEEGAVDEVAARRAKPRPRSGASSNADVHAGAGAARLQISNENLATLMALGFDEGECLVAFDDAKGNMEVAAALLLDVQDRERVQRAREAEQRQEREQRAREAEQRQEREREQRAQEAQEAERQKREKILRRSYAGRAACPARRGDARVYVRCGRLPPATGAQPPHRCPAGPGVLRPSMPCSMESPCPVGSASTAVGALSARSAAGLRSASTTVGALSARSAAGHQSASTAVSAISARSAVGLESASTGRQRYYCTECGGASASASTAVGALSARSAAGLRSASTTVGALSARSAAGHQSASTAVGALSARSAAGLRSASTTVGAIIARSVRGRGFAHT